MAIFPVLITEDVVQIDDKTRLDARKSYVSKGENAITKVEIEPEAGNGYIEVTGTSPKDWYLDWTYQGLTREILARVRVTAGLSGPEVRESIFLFKELEDDKLFSSDQDILAIRSDILRWLPDGKSSFNNKHRQAQREILDWLDENGYRLADSQKIKAEHLLDKDEVRRWSAYWALSYIFGDAHNSADDVFRQQARDYYTKGLSHADRAILTIDLNQDGNVQTGEGANIRSTDLVRT